MGDLTRHFAANDESANVVRFSSAARDPLRRAFAHRAAERAFSEAELSNGLFVATITQNIREMQRWARRGADPALKVDYKKTGEVIPLISVAARDTNADTFRALLQLEPGPDPFALDQDNRPLTHYIRQAPDAARKFKILGSMLDSYTPPIAPDQDNRPHLTVPVLVLESKFNAAAPRPRLSSLFPVQAAPAAPQMGVGRSFFAGPPKPRKPRGPGLFWN